MQSIDLYKDIIKKYSFSELLEEKKRVYNEIDKLEKMSYPDEVIYQEYREYSAMLLKAIEDIKKDKKEQFEIISFENGFCAASNFFIPFELPERFTEKRENIQLFKSVIEENLKKLKVNQGEVLLGQYRENTRMTRYDIENRLFYNLGTRMVKHCAKYGVAFAQMPKSVCGSIEKPYFYSYQIEKEEDVCRYFEKLKLLAEWREIELLPYPHCPFKFYKRIRSNNHIQVSGTEWDGDFALKINLSVSKIINLASYMKAVIDGVVCAFHKESGNTKRNLAKKYDNYTVNENFPCLLGEQDYFRTNGAWNPADERLKLCLITLEHGSKNPRFSGELYAMN